MKNILEYKWQQISSRQRMSPFPNLYSMESVTKEMKGVIGRAYETTLFLFEGNLFYGMFDENDYLREANFTFAKLKKDPRILSKLTKRVQGFSRSFLPWLEKISKKNLTKTKNQELVSFYKNYVKNYKRIYSHYFVILALERPLTEYLKNLVYEKAGDEEKASQDFNILVTEPSAMVARQEELAALQIAVKILKNKRWKELFQMRAEEVEGKIRLEPALYKVIKKHEKNFFWLTRDYEDPVLTINDIIRRIKNHLVNNPVQKLAAYKNEAKNLIIKRNRLIKELKLTKKELALFSAMRDGMYLKELRKTIVSKSLYYFDSVLNEICRRGSINLRQARFLVGEEEVASVLEKDKDWKKILDERIRRSVYFTVKGKTKIIVGNEADEIFQKFVEVNKSIKIIKGFAAAPGKAEGIVKVVINPNECDKVQKGDIIVSVQVVPSFSPCIARAAGIICDGGTGITSHPATLAREAKIPCVTSAKITTRVLKDGDRVEVDGNKGIVKIIK